MQWRVGPEPHTAQLTLHTTTRKLDKLGLLSLTAEGLQIGPALVHLSFQSIAGRGVMLQYILPLEENVQKFVHTFYTARSWIPPYAKVSTVCSKGVRQSRKESLINTFCLNVEQLWSKSLHFWTN